MATFVAPRSTARAEVRRYKINYDGPAGCYQLGRNLMLLLLRSE